MKNTQSRRKRDTSFISKNFRRFLAAILILYDQRDHSLFNILRYNLWTTRSLAIIHKFKLHPRALIRIISTIFALLNDISYGSIRKIKPSSNIWASYLQSPQCKHLNSEFWRMISGWHLGEIKAVKQRGREGGSRQGGRKQAGRQAGRQEGN
jgi:hypothetical protein